MQINWKMFPKFHKKKKNVHFLPTEQVLQGFPFGGPAPLGGARWKYRGCGNFHRKYILHVII